MKIRVLISLLFTLYIFQSCTEEIPLNEKSSISSTYHIFGKYYAPADSQQIIISKYDPVTQKRSPLDTANVSPVTGEYKLEYEFTGADLLDKLVSEFERAQPELPMAKVMREKVERYKKVAIGADAPEIAENNREGIVVKLSEAKKKVTLIDFWASWCGPCLRQIPDLKEAYELYHEKGFEIFGVSVDSNGKRWMASIDKYEMTWPNVSNLKGWGSEAAASYNVTFIPFNVLLDENGKIIAKNLHSKELQSKLAELLGMVH